MEAGFIAAHYPSQCGRANGIQVVLIPTLGVSWHQGRRQAKRQRGSIANAAGFRFSVYRLRCSKPFAD